MEVAQKQAHFPILGKPGRSLALPPERRLAAIIIPARGQFLQFDPIGRVAIHLVGAHMDKGGVGSMEPGGFEQVHCADGIGIKIIERNGGGAVMAGLCRRVDYRNRANLF